MPRNVARAGLRPATWPQQPTRSCARVGILRALSDYDPIPALIGVSEAARHRRALRCDGASRRFRGVFGPALIDALLALRSVDPTRLGLVGLGERHDRLRRQLPRWDANWRHGRSRDLADLERDHSFPRGQRFEKRRHGRRARDLRLDNCIVAWSGTALGLTLGAGDHRQETQWQTRVSCWSIEPTRTTGSPHCNGHPRPPLVSPPGKSSASVAFPRWMSSQPPSTTQARPTGGRRPASSKTCITG